MSKEERFSRWFVGGVPLLYSICLFAAVVLRFSFGIAFRRTVGPLSVIATVVAVTFYIPMYWFRQRFRSKHVLRPAVLFTGVCALVVGLLGMYYAGQIGLSHASLLHDNYLSFSVFVILVTGIAVTAASYVKL